MGGWTVTTAPTATAPGLERRDCQRSGCIHYETRPIPPTNEQQAKVTVFWLNAENNITFEGGNEVTVPPGAPFTIMATSPDYTVYSWSVNGVPDDSQTGNQFTFHTAGRTPGTNFHITFIGTRGEIFFSADFTIRIGE
jgi:hypothetical protein